VALLSVAEALDRVLAQAAPLRAEEVPLGDAEGRVLAYPLTARRTQPPADVSAMDGYAVRAADVIEAPVQLKVVGEVAAGRPFAAQLQRGEAARIFTGGVVPTPSSFKNTPSATATASISRSRVRRAGIFVFRGSILEPAKFCSPPAIV
jgi:molybdopterin biosynthesis enzyme